MWCNVIEVLDKRKFGFKRTEANKDLSQMLIGIDSLKDSDEGGKYGNKRML